MSEYFDIFDANMIPAAPFKAERDVVHQQGLWHQTFHCWILRRDEKLGPSLVLQLRGDTIQFPHTFDVSAAGHLAAGEKPIDGIREAEEELGIKIDSAGLVSLGAYKQVTDDHARRYFNREFCHTYFYETDKNIHDFTPQESEVEGVFMISVQDGLRLFTGEMQSLEIHGIAKSDKGYQQAARILTSDQMCAAHDRTEIGRYYLKIFIMADLYFKGVRELAV